MPGIDDQITSAGAAATASIGVWITAVGSLAVAVVGVWVGINLVRRMVTAIGGDHDPEEYPDGYWNGAERPDDGDFESAPDGYSFNASGALEQLEDQWWQHEAGYPDAGEDPDYYEDD